MTIPRENLASFNVESEQEAHTAYLRLAGELDLAASPILEEQLLGVESNGNARIVLDLKDVTFIDSSGLRSFLRATERAGGSGRNIAIVNANDTIRRVFELTGTLHLLAEDPASHTSSDAASRNGNGEARTTSD